MSAARPTPTTSMSPAAADDIAVRVFAFIAASEVRTARFLTDTGIEQGTVRRAARTPAFLRGVLDYVLGDTDLLGDVAEATAISPEALASAARNMTRPSAPSAQSAPAEQESKAARASTRFASALPRPSLFRDRRPGEAA